MTFWLSRCYVCRWPRFACETVALLRGYGRLRS